MEAEVVLPRDGDHQKSARVVGVSRNNEGQKIGEFNRNPILNTKVYDVMFPDGAVHQYEAKAIAENIYSQVDEDCHKYQLMDHINNHKSYGRALPKIKAFTVPRNRNRARKQTTKVWYLEVCLRGLFPFLGTVNASIFGNTLPSEL